VASTSPVVASWELAARLRARREELGLDPTDLARALGFTRNYWWAVENDKTVLSMPKLQATIKLFGFDPPEAAILLQLRALTKQRDWWSTHPSGISEPLQRLYGLEHGAERVRAYEGLVVTGLLQTSEYTRALMAADPGLSAVQIDRLVDIRLRRQERLRTPEPLQLTVVLGEGALMQQIGGSATLCQQLRHLRSLIDDLAGSLSLHVRPFTAPASGVSGAATVYLLQFTSPFVPLAGWVESPARFGITSDPDELKLLDLNFEDALATALDQQASRRFIDKRIRALR
jgi:transcriptional regulator with XRE-family HTH domain